MCRVDQILQRRFKDVLIGKGTLDRLLLDLIQTTEEIHGRLLIACRRVLQISQGALKLKGVAVVGEKAGGDGGIERHTD